MLVDHRMHDDRSARYERPDGQNQGHRQRAQQLGQRPRRRIHATTNRPRAPRRSRRRRWWPWRRLLAVAALAAGSRAIRPLHVHLSVSVEGLPGALNRITPRSPRPPGARCWLRVSEARRRRSFASPAPASVVWRWVSSVAGQSGGRGVFLASCREGSRWAWWRYRAEPGLARIGGAFVSAPGIAGRPAAGADRARGAVL